MTRATEVTSRVSASIDDIDVSKALSVNIVHIIGFYRDQNPHNRYLTFELCMKKQQFEIACNDPHI